MAGRRKARAARAAALIGSLALNAAVLAVLTRYTVLPQTPAQAPVMSVELVSPPRSAPAEPTRPSERRDQTARDARPAIHQTPPAPADIAVYPAAAADAPARAGDLPTAALRGLGGCDRPQLSREERETCEARRWERAGPAMAAVELDLARRYAVDPEPVLSRRPKNGCGVRVTGDEDARGETGAARAGFTCVKPF